MKNICVMVLLSVCLSIVLGGCAGVADSADERHVRHAQNREGLSRQFWDDWDYFMLQERNSWLSDYHEIVGN